MGDFRPTSAELHGGEAPPPAAAAVKEEELDAGAQFVLKSRGDDRSTHFLFFCYLFDLIFFHFHLFAYLFIYLFTSLINWKVLVPNAM